MLDEVVLLRGSRKCCYELHLHDSPCLTPKIP
jgi:hypothetical protein